MTPEPGQKKTKVIANTHDLTNIKHYCVVNPGSQLLLNVSVGFDFESTIMPSRYFFSLDTHARTRTSTHFKILRFGHISLCSHLMKNDLLRFAV